MDKNKQIILALAAVLVLYIVLEALMHDRVSVPTGRRS